MTAYKPVGALALYTIISPISPCPYSLSYLSLAWQADLLLQASFLRGFQVSELEAVGLIEKRKRGGGLPSIIYVKNFTSASAI